MVSTMNMRKLDNPDEKAPMLLPVLVAGVLAAVTGTLLMAALLGLLLTVAD